MAQVPVALLDANVQADINPAPKQQDPQKIVQPAAQLAAQPDAQPQPQDPLVQPELRGLTSFEFVTKLFGAPRMTSLEFVGILTLLR